MIPEQTDDETRTCPDCRQPWLLPADTRAWYEARDLYLPRRCADCRAARRRQREQQPEESQRLVG